MQVQKGAGRLTVVGLAAVVCSFFTILAAGPDAAAAESELCVSLALGSGNSDANATRFRVAVNKTRFVPIPQSGGMCLRVAKNESAEIEANQRDRGWRTVCAADGGFVQVVWLGGPRCSKK